MPVEFDPIALLQTLCEYQVEFIVIGGFAAWIHGAPVVTMDLDIVYSATEDNAIALVGALKELDACYRQQENRKLVPNSIEISGSVSLFAPLERIISLKEAANRPKDQAALPTLRSALKDSEQQ